MQLGESILFQQKYLHRVVFPAPGRPRIHTNPLFMSIMAENFDRLPEDVRNLLFTLVEKDETAVSVADAVASNFDRFPEDVRNLLFALAF